MNTLNISNRINQLAFLVASVLILGGCSIVPNPEAELSIVLARVNGQSVNNITSLEAYSGEKLILEFNITASEGIRRFEVIPNNIFNADFKDSGIGTVRKTIIAEFEIPKGLTGRQFLNFRLEDFEGNRKEAQITVSLKEKEAPLPTGPPIFPFGR